MTTSPLFVRFDLDAITPIDDAPAPDCIVAGTPTNRTWLFEETADAKTFSGVWESTPGAWRVSYDEWEFCSILSGHAILHLDGQPPNELRPGDSFVIRPGFSGVWEVRETIRKLFVINMP